MDTSRGRTPRNLLRPIPFASATLIFLSLVFSPLSWCQSRESATETRPSLWAGGEISGYTVQFGERKMWGASALIDADSAYHIGLEGEGRWLEFHQTANVHLETYMIGPRYHVTFGRLQPFVKGAVGFGNFNFSYNYAYGTYLVVGAGGGVDYSLNHRWSVRLAEVQYQDWPQFTFGAMNNVGVSSGIRYRIF